MSEEMIIPALIVISAWLLVTLLNVILFFKIWRMTNDIRDIRDTLDEWEHPLK